jgi:hypothetical protein
MGLLGVAIETYRPQYRPLSAIRYLDVNPLPTRYTLFSTLATTQKELQTKNLLSLIRLCVSVIPLAAVVRVWLVYLCCPNM